MFKSFFIGFGLAMLVSSFCFYQILYVNPPKSLLRIEKELTFYPIYQTPPDSLCYSGHDAKAIKQIKMGLNNLPNFNRKQKGK